MLAELLDQAGRGEEALKAVNDGLDLAKEPQEPFHKEELHRLKGKLLLKRNPSEVSDQKEAEDCFNLALRIAQEQKAKILELRALMSLYRLYQRQGRASEVRRRLKETYEWFERFREGLDTGFEGGKSTC